MICSHSFSAAAGPPDSSVFFLESRAIPARRLGRDQATRRGRRHRHRRHPSATGRRLEGRGRQRIPIDPDARIPVKTGKARALNDLCRLAVDTATGVIGHVQADLADSRDRVHLPRLLRGLRRRLRHRLRANELPLRELLADAGYANGPDYALLEARHITAWIPVLGKHKSEDDGFRYDAPTDSYPCPAGKHLRFQLLDTASEGRWV